MSIPIKSTPLKRTWNNPNDYPIPNPSTKSSPNLGGFLGIGQSIFNMGLSEMQSQAEFGRQLQFWDMQNRYNSPIAQRNRLNQAGLNPSEGVESHPAGELSSVPKNEVMANGALDFVNQLEVFSHMEKMGAESDLLAQQFKLSVVEEAIKRGNLFGINLDNRQKSILLKYLDSKEQFTLSKLISEISNLDSETNLNIENTKSVKEKRPYEVGNLLSNIEESKSRTQKNVDESKWLIDTLELEKNLKDAQTKEAKARAAQAYAEARVANIKADLENKFGEDLYQAKVTDAQSAARYADTLRSETWDLLDSIEKLNENQALTNEARVEIEQAAQDLKERTLQFEKTKYAVDTVKDILTSAMSNIDKITNFVANVL